MVSQNGQIDGEFKQEIEERLRILKHTKSLNALTLQVNGMRTNFDEFLGSMAKNPFTERNIMYGGDLEKDESYTRFKKDVEKIMREDIIYKNMTAEQKDLAMGENVIKGTYGTAKSVINNYHDNCTQQKKQYKWSELEPKLAKIFGNKNEIFDLSNKLSTMSSKDFKNIASFNQRFLEILQLIPTNTFNDTSINQYYYTAMEDSVKTKIRNSNKEDPMNLDRMMEIASAYSKVPKLSNYISKNINMLNKSKGYAPAAPTNASAPPGPKCFKCGELGHFIRNCPKNDKNKNNNNNRSRNYNNSSNQNKFEGRKNNFNNSFKNYKNNNNNNIILMACSGSVSH